LVISKSTAFACFRGSVDRPKRVAQSSKKCRPVGCRPVSLICTPDDRTPQLRS